MLLHVSAMLSSFSKRADVSGSSHATPPEVAVGGRSSRLRWRRGGPAALEAASEKRISEEPENIPWRNERGDRDGGG